MLYKAYNPFLQAAVVFAAMLLFMGVGWIFQTAGVDMGARFPWTTVAAFMLFFAIFNSVFSLSAKNLNQYRLRSLFSFTLLLIIAGGTAWLVSGLSPTEAGSYKWILTVIIIGYLVFLSIVGLMKTAVEFAEKEVWNQPKQRKKRRK